MTKKELELQLDDVGDSVARMLDPQLTREQVVGQLADLNDTLNGEEEEDDGSDEDDEDDEIAA